MLTLSGNFLTTTVLQLDIPYPLKSTPESLPAARERYCEYSNSNASLAWFDSSLARLMEARQLRGAVSRINFGSSITKATFRFTSRNLFPSTTACETSRPRPSTVWGNTDVDSTTVPAPT